MDSHICTPFFSSPYRRRRTIWCIILVFTLIFFFGAPWELPAYLKDIDHASGISRANVAKLLRPSNASKVDEIYGLMYLVTRGDDRSLHRDVVPDQQIPLSVYAGRDVDVDWEAEVKDLDVKYPVVVFSKSYCPYSRKAKALLSSYALEPPPRIVEVDLREDSDLIKVILARLTGRATFPNVIVHGKTVGGSDELERLHADGQLAATLDTIA